MQTSLHVVIGSEAAAAERLIASDVANHDSEQLARRTGATLHGRPPAPRRSSRPARRLQENVTGHLQSPDITTRNIRSVKA